MATPFFRINGIDFPQPQKGLQGGRYQLVDGGRGANGQMYLQKINSRRLEKFDNVVFSFLTAQQFVTLSTEVEKLTCSVYYWSAHENKYITRNFYFGDLSFEYGQVDKSTGAVLSYTNVSVNLIDMGA